MKFFGVEISSLMLGSEEITKAYFNGEIVFDKNDSGLVGAYLFNGNLIDSKRGNNATSVSTSFVTGKLGQAIDVPLDTNYSPYVAYTIDHVFESIPFSIDMWLSRHTTTGNQYILSRRNTSSNVEWFIVFSGTDLIVNLNTINNTNYIRATKTISIPINTFYHLAITFDGSTNASGIKIYVNGSLSGNSYTSAGTFTGIVDRASPTVFGNFGGSVFNGIIDNVNIWKNKELNSTEISYLYNSGAGREFPDLP